MVYKTETQPPESQQLYTTYASCLAANIHFNNDASFLDHKAHIRLLSDMFKTSPGSSDDLSRCRLCSHVFLAAVRLRWLVTMCWDRSFVALCGKLHVGRPIQAFNNPVSDILWDKASCCVENFYKFNLKKILFFFLSEIKRYPFAVFYDSE